MSTFTKERLTTPGRMMEWKIERKKARRERKKKAKTWIEQKDIEAQDKITQEYISQKNKTHGREECNTASSIYKAIVRPADHPSAIAESLWSSLPPLSSCSLQDLTIITGANESSAAKRRLSVKSFVPFGVIKHAWLL
jgi:hypothetical protein